MPNVILIIESLRREIAVCDARTRKLFYKQKQFMELNMEYNSLGKRKLQGIIDKYGNNLCEIRLDRKRRIVFVKRDDSIIWLKICSHDELKRNDKICIKDDY